MITIVVDHPPWVLSACRGDIINEASITCSSVMVALEKTKISVSLPLGGTIIYMTVTIAICLVLRPLSNVHVILSQLFLR